MSPAPCVLDAPAVKARALRGIRAGSARVAASLALKVVSSVVLARLLLPADYGVFGAVAYMAGLAWLLCDMGLVAALVRQSRSVSDDDERTVFVAQLVQTAMVVAVVVAISPLLVRLYELPAVAQGCLAAAAAGHLLSALRAIPVMRLQRQLRFGTLAGMELLEHAVLTATTIALAWRGLGFWALIGGVLCRNAASLIFVWAVWPYRPRGHFRWEILRRLAVFAIPFQATEIALVVVGGWMPLIIGRWAGVDALGLVNWALGLATVPMLLCVQMERVAFPAFSRLQHQPQVLRAYLESAVRRLSYSMWLVLPVGVLAAPLVVPAVFGTRWQPAVPLVQWLGAAVGLTAVTTILHAALNATGHASDRLRITLAAGALRWILGGAMVWAMGIDGVGPAVLASAGLELAAVVYFTARRGLSGRTLIGAVAGPAVFALLSIVAASGIASLLLPGRPKHAAGASLVLYASAVLLREFAVDGHSLAGELRRCLVLLLGSGDRAESAEVT